MGSNKVITGENDLLSQNPTLALEWNYNKNALLTPDKVAYQSNKKVWWICPKCSYEWDATVNNRNRGNGCPCCSNQVVVYGKNDLFTCNKSLADEWNFEKNDSLTPDKIVYKSGKKVWWRCKKCNHEWKTTVASRANGAGCPKCGKKKQLESFHKNVISKRGSLSERYPKLLNEWLYIKNNRISPEEVMPGSNEKVWWKCSKCGHEWEATIHSRACSGVGCPVCANKLLVSGINDLETKHPELLEEWDYNKNSILPSEVVAGSDKKVWWVCKKCSFNWKASICSRISGTGCPDCKSKAQTSFPEQAIFFYMQKCFPDAVNRFIESDGNKRFELDIYIPSIKLAIEYDGLAWHNTENSRVKERNKYLFCKNRNIKLIRIKERDETYQDNTNIVADEIIFCKNHPQNDELNNIILRIFFEVQKECDVDCDRDAIMIRENYYRDIEKKSIAKLHPELLVEWNYEKNGKIKPSMVSSGSREAIWWRCDKGHEWKVSPANRVFFKSQCPYCSNKKVLKGFNDVATTHPEVLKKWDYEKNNITPDEVSYGYSKKVWWVCEKGHHYETSVYQFINLKGDKCPICSGKQIMEGFNDLATVYPNLAREWNENKNTIKINKVGRNSNKKVWWVCEKGHEWEATIANRTKGTGCPYCSNRRVLQGYNDLSTTNPELLKEWDYEKNDFEPITIMIGSSKKVWWICPVCGYEWQVAPVNRKKANGCYTGCPVCEGNAIKPGYNDFETKCMEAAKHWNYEKNGSLLPSMFGPKSEKKVWWKCDEGHEYLRKICYESRGYGCPVCRKMKCSK